jgi:prevent-host-death family protein
MEDVMEVPTIVPISELRVRQSEILEQVAQAPVVLTHRGKAAAVLVHPERWNHLLQQIEHSDDLITVLSAELAVARGEAELIDADIEDLQAMTKASAHGARLPT